MAQQRYDLRKEPNGTWTVFDVFTGLPVEVGLGVFTGLTMEEADDAVGLLNALDRRRRGRTPAHPRSPDEGINNGSP